MKYFKILTIILCLGLLFCVFQKPFDSCYADNNYLTNTNFSSPEINVEDCFMDDTYLEETNISLLESNTEGYVSEDTRQTDTIPSRNYTVVIDPGHGGTDPGSIGYKTKVHESDLNLEMSLLLKSKLEGAGINVVMTRSTKKSLLEGAGKTWKRKDMELRRELIEKTRPNMVISLHQNSYTNHSLRGAQVFYDKKSDISKQIADSIQEQFKQNLDKSIKATSPGDYFMLKCSAAPSVIIECGFLSNAEEEKLLQTAEYQEKIIDSIFKGIVNFLQIK